MKKVIRRIAAYDDLYYAAGQEIEADEEVVIQIGENSYRIDLTAKHAQEFRTTVDKWIKVANMQPAVKRRRRRNGTGGNTKKLLAAATADMNVNQSREFYADMRRFASEEGLQNEIVSKGESGYGYGQALVRRYLEARPARIEAQLSELQPA